MANRVFMDVVLLSIAGGCISSVFLATQKKIYQYTSASFVTILNTLVIFCFVIPFFKILSYYDHSGLLLKEGDLVVWVVQGTSKYTIYATMEKMHFADCITGIWITGVMVYLLIEILSYSYFVVFIRKKSEVIAEGIWLTIYQELCEEYSIMGNMDLFVCKAIFQPCVTGMKKPMILIPNYLMNILETDEIRIILSHELTHIKKRDVPFRIFISLLNSLHWFNLLFYLLKSNLEEWMELSCDETVTANMNAVQRRAYIDVLVKLSEEQWKQRRQKAVLCFNNRDLRNIKRRVLGIMKQNRSGNQFSKAVVFTLMFGVIAGGSVIAKAADFTVNEIFSNHLAVWDAENYSIEEVDESVNPQTFIDFNAENMDAMLEDDNASLTPFVFDADTSYEIMNSNGSIEKLVEDTEISTRHQHDYKKVNIKEHKKNSNGSCKETIYEGKKCTICNQVIKGDIISETTYKKYIH